MSAGDPGAAEDTAAPGAGAAGDTAAPGAAAGEFCDACGKPAAEGDHARCRARRSISDPPRYCQTCGRRLVVQVLPASWTAACVRCGPLEPAHAADSSSRYSV